MIRDNDLNKGARHPIIDERLNLNLAVPTYNKGVIISLAYCKINKFRDEHHALMRELFRGRKRSNE